MDGFLDDHGKPARISSTASDVLVHRWRSEEQAILVGSRTVVNDDPQLTVRLVNGKNPLRVVIDRKNTSRASSRIFDGTAPTLLVSRSDPKVTNADVLLIGDRDPIDALLAALHQRDIRSLLVEGGAELLSHFISRGLWNEARVITGSRALKNGTRAPELGMSSTRSLTSSSDSVDLFVNGSAPEATWYW